MEYSISDFSFSPTIGFSLRTNLLLWRYMVITSMSTTCLAVQCWEPQWIDILVYVVNICTTISVLHNTTNSMEVDQSVTAKILIGKKAFACCASTHLGYHVLVGFMHRHYILPTHIKIW